jgi:hypothetical protein
MGRHSKKPEPLDTHYMAKGKLLTKIHAAVAEIIAGFFY